MSAKIGTVYLDIKADTAKLVSGMDSAGRSIKKSINNIKTTVVSLAAAYAGLEGIRAFKNMISDSIDAADATGKLAEKLGMTSKKLSELRYAASYAAVDSKKLDAALSAMIRRTTNYVRTGSSAAKKALVELGISASFARKHFTSTSEILKILFNRLSKIPDGYRKTAIAQDLFSKNAAEMVRVASMGNDELRRLSKEADRMGIAVPNSFSKMSASLNDTIEHITSKTKGYKNLLSEAILPSVLAFAKTVNKWLENAFSTKGIVDFRKTSVWSLRGVIEAFGFLKDAGTGIHLVINDIEYAFYALAGAVSIALEPIRHSMNALISLNNKLAHTWVGKKAGIGVINARFESSLPHIAKKMEIIKKETIKLMYSLHSGRDEAAKFGDYFNKTLQNIIIQKNKWNKVKPKHSATNHIFGTQKQNKKDQKAISKPLIASLSVWEDYYKKLGDMKKAWLVSSSRSKAYDDAYELGLSGNKLKKYIDTYKKAFNAPKKTTQDKTNAKITYYDATGQYNKEWDLKAEGLREKFKGLLQPSEIDAIIAKYKEKFFEPLSKMGTTTADIIKDAFKTMGDSLTSSLMNFFDYSSKGFMNFGNVAKNVLHSVYMEIMKVAVIKPMVSGIMGGLSGLFGIGTSTAVASTTSSAYYSIAGFANGGAFTNSIVKEPTYFAYGDSFGGNFGVMGEAGAEAVMPLTRHSSGELGVKATPSNVIINVKNESGTPVDMKKVSEMMNDDGTKTINIVMNAIERNPDFRQAIKGIR